MLCAGALYLPRRDTPSYVTPDEVFSALTARSVASTGRDLNGRFLPLYFQLPDSFETRMWYQPIVVYAIAATLEILPFSESSVRLPMAIAAVADILLAYCVGRLLFRNEALAAAAAALLALTPAHFSDSRVAMDHHAFLFFILAWLLCLLLYLQRNKPFLMFLTGLVLGVGLFTYIASYVFMPVYVVLTGLVLYRRREPADRYALLAAGFVMPVLAGALFVAAHPTVISDTLWRYQRDKPQDAGGASLMRSFLGSERFARFASVYASFWRPRVLFISGPRAAWVAGQFVVPVAGLLAAAGLRVIRRPERLLLLLIAGLIIAPIPAALVGEPEVIRRAAGVLPFAVLLGVAGLEYVWMADAARTRRAVFVTIWGIVIGVAALYYNDVPHAQAIVRASTVPLAIAGLGVLSSADAFERVGIRKIAFVGMFVVVAMHLLYFVDDRATTIGALLLAAVGATTLLGRAPDSLAREPLRVVALVALVTVHFVYMYVDYGQPPHPAWIPASAAILGARLAVASVAFAAVLGVMRLMERAAGRMSRWQLMAATLTALVAVQFAYYSIDYFADSRWRAVHAMVVLSAGVGLAVIVRGGDSARVQLGPIALAGLLSVAVMQFAPFHADYFTGFRARGVEAQVSSRAAFEMLIDRTRDAAVPAIYLGWPNALSDLYWRFYLAKHDREDLLPRTIAAHDFDPERIRGLPGGSLVMTSASPRSDAAIDDMMKSGGLKKRDLLKDVDGTPTFWILETAGR